MACKTKNCCETTVTQKAISDKVSFTYEDGVLILIIGNKIFKIPLDIEGGGGSFSGEEITIPITSLGQTSFPNSIPINKSVFAVFLNGQKQKKTDYNTPGNVNLSWLSEIQLETDDDLAVWLQDS